MNIDRSVVQAALEALELEATSPPLPETGRALELLRAALAAPESAEPAPAKPVARIHDDGHWTHKPGKDPLGRFNGKAYLDVYATPPAPAQVPLTEAQLAAAVLADKTLRYYFAINGGAGPVSAKGFKVFRAVERAHGIGGNP